MQSQVAIFNESEMDGNRKNSEPFKLLHQFPLSFVASSVFRITELTQMFQLQEELCDHLTYYLSPGSTKMSSRQ